MDIPIKIIKDFLESNPKNAIDLYDTSTGVTFLPKTTMQHVVEKHGDIETFFHYVKIQHQKDVVGVQKLKPNGSSYKKYQNGVPLKLSISNKPLEGDATNGAPVDSVVAPNVATPQVPIPRSYQPEIMPQNHQAQGLNAYQIAEGMANKDRLVVKQEKIDELKEKIQEQKTDALTDKTTIANLQQQLSKANAELAVAEQKKEMAVMMEVIKKQPSIPPEVIAKLTENLPALFMALKGGGSVAQANPSGLAADHSNLSPSKQGLISYIGSEDLDETTALLIEKTVVGITNIDDDTFRNAIIKLTETA
jgi:hypothetical protein